MTISKWFISSQRYLPNKLFSLLFLVLYSIVAVGTGNVQNNLIKKCLFGKSFLGQLKSKTKLSNDILSASVNVELNKHSNSISNWQDVSTIHNNL